MQTSEHIDRLMWMRHNLKIIPKNGSMCFLEPNVGQLMLWQTMNEQRLAGLPIRIVLLKPRQVGWSTWSCAEAFTYAYFNAFYNTGLFSLDDDSTDHIFRMIKLFYDELSEKDKRPTDNTNRKEVIYAKPHRSRMISQTAGKKGAGHSYTFRYVHCSEVSRWKDCANTLAGIYQSISNEPGTVMILESTANGMGGVFYDKYWEAVADQKRHPGSMRGYLPVFFPWYKFPAYATAIYDGFKITEDEEEQVALFGLSNEQILWRRDKIEEVNGDLALFKESYPATAIEAFQASGNPVFSQRIKDYEKSTIVVNPRCCIFEIESGVPKLIDVNRKENCWQIVHMPGEAEYSMGCDTKEDKISDMSDEKSKLDYDGAAVLNRISHEYVAIWKGRTETIDFAKQCFACCLFYNEAWFVPEIPKGMTVLRYFVSKDYQFIYNRQVHEERGDSEDSDNLGFRTDMTTRRWLVDDFITMCHQNSIRVCFQTLYDEMTTFIKDKTGKSIHMPGKHDDVLFGAFLALQGDKRCPRLTSDNYVGKPIPLDKNVNIAYSGAIDVDDDHNEDEDDAWNYTI